MAFCLIEDKEVIDKFLDLAEVLPMGVYCFCYENVYKVTLFQ